MEEQRLPETLPLHDAPIQRSLWKEGSPGSIAEAMVSGLPVVATPVGGIAEQVVDGKTGFLISEQDVQGMAAVMRRLACDLELRQILGRAGRERVVKLYDSSFQTRRLQEVLLRVAGL